MCSNISEGGLQCSKEDVFLKSQVDFKNIAVYGHLGLFGKEN
jgi:hypothetical protein